MDPLSDVLSRTYMAGAFDTPGKALLAALPPVVHVRDTPERALVSWVLEHLMQELRYPRPGGSLIAQQMAIMVVVQTLRAHVIEKEVDGVGWRFALVDKHLNSALGAMHDDPVRRWTLQMLAECAGMSRTTFTIRFKDKIGQTPMECLTRWRMLLAGDRLRGPTVPVSAVGLSLGYESESAFSTAFKLIMGHSPRQHGRTYAPNSKPRPSNARSPCKRRHPASQH